MTAVGPAPSPGLADVVGNRRPTRPYWRLHLTALSALLAVASGCREELGPVTFPTTRVAGVVRAGGRPVGGGWIEFVPYGKTVGNLRSAPIAPDGTFEATGVAVGPHIIGLVDVAPVDPPGLGRLFQTQGSPIRRVIPPGPATRLEIDLVEETIRHQREKTQEAPETSR